MSEFHGIRCDECKTIKEEANHWHRIRVVYKKLPGQVEYRVDELEPVQIRLGDVDTIGDLSNSSTSNRTSKLLDLCSDNCLTKHVYKLLSQIKKEDQPKCQSKSSSS